jgi:transposase
MKRFIEGEDRSQSTLFPEHLDDYIAEDNPVRVIDVFVDELDLKGLGFEGMQPEVTGRPAYHPASLLKIYIYGYLNRIQSSRRLERETQRNVELIWLTGRLMPDFKTIADFRRDNGKAIRRVCREFIVLCRELKLFSEAIVAIDGSKFKAVNNRDKNFTDRKLKARMQQLEESIARYLTELDRADREPALVTEARVEHIKKKVATVKAIARQSTWQGVLPHVIFLPFASSNSLLSQCPSCPQPTSSVSPPISQISRCTASRRQILSLRRTVRRWAAW